MKKFRKRWSPAWAALLGVASAHAASTGGCDDYAIDVSRELAAMATPPAASAADVAAPVTLESGAVYRLHLSPQQGFPFIVPPAREQPADGVYAGRANFTVPAAGRWRVSLGSAGWIDVVGAQNELVPAGRFEGRPECAVLRKWVEFPLDANARYTLQLSGATAPDMVVSISGPVPEAP